MHTIKFTSKTTLKLNGIKYKGYLVGDLPSSFGFIYNEDNDRVGQNQWFNLKGMTWLTA